MTSTTAVESLIEMGRQRGGLDIDDIRRALPVDTMSIEELSDVLAHLDEAGIPVEIDFDLANSSPPKSAPARSEAYNRALATQRADDDSSRPPDNSSVIDQGGERKFVPHALVSTSIRPKFRHHLCHCGSIDLDSFGLDRLALHLM